MSVILNMSTEQHKKVSVLQLITLESVIINKVKFIFNHYITIRNCMNHFELPCKITTREYVFIIILTFMTDYDDFNIFFFFFK